MNVGKFRFVVVGAGFSGSVIAERIASALKENVLVIEKRSHIGGNAFDFEDNGIIVQKYGPHIFHTKSEEAWNYISRFTEWIPYRHRVRAFVKGRFVPLPFNFKAIDELFSEEEAKEFKTALAEEFGLGSRVSIFDLADSKNSMVRTLSGFIYENVFLNYTVKQWGVSPGEIDKAILKRVPVVISYEDAYFTDKYQGIPKKGFTAVFAEMLKNERIKVLLNKAFFDLFSLDFEQKKIFLKNGEEFKGVVFYTGCADELFNYKFGQLGYRTLKFEFEKHKLRFYQKVAVVNYPNDFDFTRITEFKHFYGINAEHTIIAKEFPREMKKGDVPYYPILNKENESKYKNYETEAKKFRNLVLLGRLGGFKYLNMDEAVLNALKVFEKIIGKK